MPPARKPAVRRVVGPVEKATRADVAAMAEEVRASALAASAIALAAELDSPKNGGTSKSMIAKAHLDVMDRLRDLAPPKRERDKLDDLAERRAARLAQGGSAP